MRLRYKAQTILRKSFCACINMVVAFHLLGGDFSRGNSKMPTFEGLVANFVSGLF